MCTHCHLATPRGEHDVCHSCAIALRAEARRGLDELQRYLAECALFDGLLGDEE